MVTNLVENALKYAPGGPIVLRAGPAGAGPAVRVEVEDRGPGVPPEERARVWDTFYRGARVTAAAGPVPGSGIGLAVVKALAQAHGGRVGVEGAAGGGARFWFELPAPGPAGAPGLPAAARRTRGGRPAERVSAAPRPPAPSPPAWARRAAWRPASPSGRALPSRVARAGKTVGDRRRRSLSSG